MKKHPATPEEMRAFLKADGWKKVKGCIYYWNPDESDHWPHSIKHAYDLAKRRKAARERAALKRAGYDCMAKNLYLGPPWKYVNGTPARKLFTRQEALAKLADGPFDKWPK